MKKAILIAATAAITLSGFAASAQPYGGRYGDRDRDGRPNYAERGWDRDRDGRPDQRDRFDNRRGNSYYGQQRWNRGQRFDNYRNRGYIVSDYRRHGWGAPPRGYAYYRADNGDVVMAALATGIIASVIAGGYR